MKDGWLVGIKWACTADACSTELQAKRVDALRADSKPRWTTCPAALLLVPKPTLVGWWLDDWFDSTELDLEAEPGESSYDPEAELAFLFRRKRRRRLSAFRTRLLTKPPEDDGPSSTAILPARTTPGFSIRERSSDLDLKVAWRLRRSSTLPYMKWSNI